MGADKIPNPKVLEPSAGSGRFLGYQPPEMAARSTRTAVELDNLTAGMVKHLYPNTTVWNTGFQDAPIPDDSFDLAISNVPFGNYGVHDQEYLGSGRKSLTGSIHNYFFAKTLDKLRPRRGDGVHRHASHSGTLRKRGESVNTWRSRLTWLAQSDYPTTLFPTRRLSRILSTCENGAPAWNPVMPVG